MIGIVMILVVEAVGKTLTSCDRAIISLVTTWDALIVPFLMKESVVGIAPEIDPARRENSK